MFGGGAGQMVPAGGGAPGQPYPSLASAQALSSVNLTAMAVDRNGTSWPFYVCPLRALRCKGLFDSLLKARSELTTCSRRSLLRRKRARRAEADPGQRAGDPRQNQQGFRGVKADVSLHERHLKSSAAAASFQSAGSASQAACVALGSTSSASKFQTRWSPMRYSSLLATSPSSCLCCLQLVFRLRLFKWQNEKKRNQDVEEKMAQVNTELALQCKRMDVVQARGSRL